MCFYTSKTENIWNSKLWALTGIRYGRPNIKSFENLVEKTFETRPTYIRIITYINKPRGYISLQKWTSQVQNFLWKQKWPNFSKSNPVNHPKRHIRNLPCTRFISWWQIENLYLGFMLKLKLQNLVDYGVSTHLRNQHRSFAVYY